MQNNGKTSAELVNRRLGESVKEAREAAGMNQTDLAAALGAELNKPMNPTTITRLEKGSRPTPLHEVYALAKTLGVPVSSLIPAGDKLSNVTAPFLFEREMMQHRVDSLQADLTEANRRLFRTYQVSSCVDLLRRVMSGESVKVEVEELESAVARLFTAIHERGKNPLPELSAALELPDRIPEEVKNWAHRLEGQADFYEQNLDTEKVAEAEAAMFARLTVDYFIEEFGEDPNGSES